MIDHRTLPRKAEKDKRTTGFGFKTTASENAAIARKIKKSGLSPSEYLRRAALDAQR